MERVKIIEGLKTQQKELDEDTNEILHKIIDVYSSGKNPKGEFVLIRCLNSLSRLIEDITNELSGYHDTYSLLENLASVNLAILCIQDICNVSQSDVNKIMNLKIQRVKEIFDIMGEMYKKGEKDGK